MVRHPVYMAKHWFNYIDRVGTDLREFTLSIGESGKISWFASEMNEERKKQVLLIPFESFVLEPYKWIQQSTQLLDTEETRVTNNILKKQKFPRKTIHAGKGHSGYGFDNNTTALSERDDYERRWALIREKASAQAIEVLESLADEYSRKYVFPRAMPWEN